MYATWQIDVINKYVNTRKIKKHIQPNETNVEPLK